VKLYCHDQTWREEDHGGVDRMHVLMSTRAPESGRSKIHLQAAVGFEVSLSLIQVIASCRTSANAR
jgi:glycosyltransferase A (GT-A) superfamily protein (DUF2064 family)